MCYCAASSTRQYFALDADPSLQIATYRTAAKILLSWVVIAFPLCRQFEPFRDGPKTKSKKVLNSLYTTHSIAFETGNAGESDWTAGLISLCDCQLFHLVTSPQTTPARTCIRRSMHAVGDRFTSKLCRPLRFPSPAKVAWGLRGTRIPCCRPRKVRGQSRRTVPPPEGPRHRRARAIHSWLPTRGSSSRRRRA